MKDKQQNTNAATAFLALIAIILVAGIVLYAWMNLKGTEPVDTVPPDDETPGQEVPVVPTGWETVNDTADHVTFAYPKDVGGKYVSATDWPPQAQVTTDAYACVTGGTSTDRAGRTEEKTVNGHAYCVTVEAEGAAGSVYLSNAYAFVKDAKTVILTFTLRTPQCGNYDEPERATCMSEQTNFNTDNLADQVASTLRFTK